MTEEELTDRVTKKVLWRLFKYSILVYGTLFVLGLLYGIYLKL